MSLSRRFFPAFAVFAVFLGPISRGETPGSKEKTERAAKEPVRTDLYGDPLPEHAIARIGTVRWRHPRVSVVAFSPDGQLLASGGDGVVRLWSASTGKELARFQGGPDEAMWSMVFSPDGKTLAAGATDTHIRLWEVATGKEPRLLKGHGSRVSRLAFSADGTTLTSVDLTGRVFLWDVVKGQLSNIKFGSVGGGQKAGKDAPVAISPDGKIVAFNGPKGSIDLWDVATDEKVGSLRGHDLDPFVLAFSEDGKTLASWSEDNTLRIWDSVKKKEVLKLAWSHGKPTTATLIFSPDGKTLVASTSERTLAVLDVVTGKGRGEFANPTWGARSVAFTHDGKTFAVASEDGTIRLLETATGRQRFPLPPPQPPLPQPTAGTFVLAADGKSLIMACDDGAIRFWDVATGKVVRSLAAPRVWALALPADEKTLVSISASDKRVHIWDLETGKERSWATEHDRFPQSIALTKDGNTLATGGEEGTICLWDIVKGKEIAKLVGHKWPVVSLAFTPDGKTLVSGSRNRDSIHIWDVEKGKAIRQLPGQGRDTYVELSPDGKGLAVANDDLSIRLWDVATGKEGLELRGDAVKPLCVTHCPDGKQLAWVGTDRAIHLCAADTGKELHRLPELHVSIGRIVFSPNGNTLVSHNGDGTILIWDVTARQAKTPPSRGKLQADTLKRLWEDLGERDDSRASRAFWDLASATDQTFELLHEHLQAAPRPDPEVIPRLIKNLDSKEFDTREKATTELEEMGELAGPALRAVLKGSPSAEMERRAKALVERLEQQVPPSGQVRPVRAILLLEMLGSPESCRVLKTLAGGAPEARSTKEAQAALNRLKVQGAMASGRMQDDPHRDPTAPKP